MGKYSYFGLGSETNEVRNKKLQAEVEDGVDVEGDRDGGFELLSFRSFLNKGDVTQSACSRKPAGPSQDCSEELWPALHAEGLLRHLPVVENL